VSWNNDFSFLACVRRIRRPGARLTAVGDTRAAVGASSCLTNAWCGFALSLLVLVGVSVWFLPRGQWIMLRSIHQPRFDRREHKSNPRFQDTRIHTRTSLDGVGSNVGVIYPAVLGLEDAYVWPFRVLVGLVRPCGQDHTGRRSEGKHCR